MLERLDLHMISDLKLPLSNRFLTVKGFTVSDS